jgi:membrane-associated phospholipid phosphatase
MLFVMFVVYLAMKRKITVIVFIIFIHMKSYVIYVTKLAFMDPRPFWSTTHVKQLEWGCPDQYGNPSGHSSSIFFYAMILNDIIFRN